MTEQEIMEMFDRDMAGNDVSSFKNRVGNLAMTYRRFGGDETRDFENTIKALKQKYPSVFESFNGSPELASEKNSSYNEKDFTDAVFELKQNLCDERIKDVMIIGRKVYGGKAQTASQNSREHISSPEAKRPIGERKARPETKRPMGETTTRTERKKTTGEQTALPRRKSAKSKNNGTNNLLPLIAAGAAVLIGILLLMNK